MWRVALVLCLFLVPAAGLPACGGGGGGATPDAARDYVGTQSPGDLWTWSVLPGGTWSAANSTLGYTYAGTWTTLPSSYLELTITETTEPGASVGDKAYALEVPDTALVVKPAGAGSNLIIAARLGACAAGPTLALNWVEVTDATWDDATSDAYGVAAVTVSGATWTGSVDAWLLDGTSLGSDTMPTFSCSGGVVRNVAAPSEVIALAPTGAFISDNGPGGGGVMGMTVPPAPIVLADLVAAGREYRAFQYKDASSGSDDSRASWARAGEGRLTAGDYKDIVLNLEDNLSTATITFDSQPLPGIVRGTLDDGAGSSDIIFVVNRLGGRYFMFGIAVDTSDTKPYNFVAIEQ